MNKFAPILWAFLLAVAYLGVNVISIVDDLGAPRNCYRVAAFNDAGESAFSNTAQVKQPTQPPPCKNRGKKCR